MPEGWSRQAADYVDSTAVCPRCGGTIGPALVCGTCRAILSGEEAVRVHAASQQAAAALRTDLDRCVTGANGGLQVDEGWRTMPYLGAGSVGIGMVIDDYLAHRADEEFERARAAILPAACSQFYVQPGLFRGRAGMVLHLGRTTAPGRPPGALEEQIAGLDWYAMPYAGGLAFPGDQMMRLSMDLATGTAGVLLALGAALHSEPVGLPFLPPPSRRDPEPAPNPGS